MKSVRSFTSVQKTILDACQPLIDHAIKEERERVIKMKQGCAEDCTHQAQYILSNLKKPVEESYPLEGMIGLGMLLHRYKTDKLGLKYATALFDTFNGSFLTSHNLETFSYTFDKNKINLSEKNKKDYKIIFSKDLFDKAIVRYEHEYRELMTDKLERSITKYVTPEFSSIHDIEINYGAKGFEIYCILKDRAQFPFNMYTQAISAGGHNIQCFHYRYITKIK